MGRKLTDCEAIRRALCIAADTEAALIDAYGATDDPKSQEPTVIQARANIEAFRRVMNRYFGGAPLERLPPATKPISLLEFLRSTSPTPKDTP